jgi:DNA-binding SARP family transcriptional activator/tetratricopeptide (TPR) repeat protein
MTVTPDVRLRFTVLGPVRVWRNGEEVAGFRQQQRAMLAMLLAKAGEPVGMAELVDMLWPADPPPSAANAVHRYVGTLRRAFEPDLPPRQTGRWLVRHGAGYRLHADTESLDLLGFRAFDVEARNQVAAGRPADAVPLFLRALDLWQGPCASGIDPATQAHPIFSAIDRERLSTARAAADAALAGGLPHRLLPVLRHLATTNHLDEPLQARLIRLLAAAGYQADALDTYRRVVATLADELGIQPGPELRDAHLTVLRQEDKPTTENPQQPSRPADTQPPALRIRPAQLPPDLPMFTGRDAELASLEEFRVSQEVESPSAVVVSTITGMAGIGKTTLAVHWAHQLTDEYPDGQLYVNLRGFDPSGSVTDLSSVLRGFLSALGMGQRDTPVDIDAQVGLYRSLLNGRRMLILLDNAVNVEQVRMLLPAAAGCLVIVTSRNELAGLAATHDVHLMTVGLFSTEDARWALVRRLGQARVAAEPEAVHDIIDSCAGLPLAIAIVGARARVHRGMPLAAVAHALRDAQTRLDALNANDSAADVRAVFSWSYRQLSPAAARLFRLLSLHDGPDVSRNAAASLLGVDGATAGPLLAELSLARLLTEHTPGRFVWHDLIHLYALELSAVDTDLDEARGRLFDYYLHSAYAMQQPLRPMKLLPAPHDPRPGVRPESSKDLTEAMRWFTAERLVLITAVQRAAADGLLSHAWQLALAMQQFFQLQGLFHDWAATMSTALNAAIELGDPAAQAYAHRSMAGAQYMRDEDDQALAHLDRTSALFTELGYVTEHAYVHANIAAIHRNRDRFEPALDHYRQALDLFRQMGHRKGEAQALTGVGGCEAPLGQPDAAITHIKEGMTIYDAIGDMNGLANTWATMANVRKLRHEHRLAITHLEQAIALYEAFGNRMNAADCLMYVGDSWLELGEPDKAATAWRQVLVTFEELRRPGIELLRERLAKVAR